MPLFETIPVLVSLRVTMLMSAASELTWYVTVINYGRHSQAISDVGLIGKDPAFSTQVSSLRQRGVQIIGPELPAMIPPYGFCNWTVPHDAMRESFSQGQEFRSYVIKYSPVVRSVWLNRIADKIRSHKWRVIDTVKEYQHGYRQMPEG
jgi:hypothetical protein